MSNVCQNGGDNGSQEENVFLRSDTTVTRIPAPHTTPFGLVTYAIWKEGDVNRAQMINAMFCSLIYLR